MPEIKKNHRCPRCNGSSSIFTPGKNVLGFTADTDRKCIACGREFKSQEGIEMTQPWSRERGEKFEKTIAERKIPAQPPPPPRPQPEPPVPPEIETKAAPLNLFCMRCGFKMVVNPGDFRPPESKEQGITVHCMRCGFEMVLQNPAGF